MTQTPLVSSCHGAKLGVGNGKEGTSYYFCLECAYPCNAVFDEGLEGKEEKGQDKCSDELHALMHLRGYKEGMRAGLKYAWASAEEAKLEIKDYESRKRLQEYIDELKS